MIRLFIKILKDGKNIPNIAGKHSERLSTKSDLWAKKVPPIPI
jgi:hypothetical protein